MLQQSVDQPEEKSKLQQQKAPILSERKNTQRRDDGESLIPDYKGRTFLRHLTPNASSDPWLAVFSAKPAMI
ncbi:unnamed protein product [Brassica rapa subsp. trilocularis]